MTNHPDKHLVTITGSDGAIIARQLCDDKLAAAQFQLKVINGNIAEPIELTEDETALDVQSLMAQEAHFAELTVITEEVSAGAIAGGAGIETLLANMRTLESLPYDPEVAKAIGRDFISVVKLLEPGCSSLSDIAQRMVDAKRYDI